MPSGHETHATCVIGSGHGHFNVVDAVFFNVKKKPVSPLTGPTLTHFSSGMTAILSRGFIYLFFFNNRTSGFFYERKKTVPLFRRARYTLSVANREREMEYRYHA